MAVIPGTPTIESMVSPGTSYSEASGKYHFGDGLGSLWYNLSSRAQNDYNTAMYERQTADSARLAAEQRAWEEKMSNSTYQRSVNDMKMAGLNPAVLSGMTSGSAVSIGSGSAASAGSSSSSSGTNGIIGALATLIGAIVLKRKPGVAKAALSKVVTTNLDRKGNFAGSVIRDLYY